MRILCYDNPDTCRREVWVNGRLKVSYDMQIFFLADASVMDLRANFGQLESGKIHVGSLDAMNR